MALTLNFHTVDDLGFACARGRLPQNQQLNLVVDELGPLVELIHLARQKPTLAATLRQAQFRGSLEGLVDAYRSGCNRWMSPGQLCGFLKLRHQQGETAPLRFCIDVHRSVLASGFGSTNARQLVAALLEMHGNILEHSEATQTGLLAFSARDGIFEFVVSDEGIGVLASLSKNPAFSQLNSHGSALALALTDGVSRYQDADRGLGFRPLFLGLAGMNGELRFRSGDHALVLIGHNLIPQSHQLLQREHACGFTASVATRTS